MSEPARLLKPLPDSPAALHVLLDEASAYVEHMSAVIVATDKVLEAAFEHPVDEMKVVRLYGQLTRIMDRPTPPIRNVADFLAWPFEDGGPIRISQAGAWMTQVVAEARLQGGRPGEESGTIPLRQRARAMSEAYARVFEALRRRIFAKLAGEQYVEAPREQTCPVQLFGADKPPSVMGVEQPILPMAKYRVVEALVNAYPGRLSLPMLRGEIRKLNGTSGPGTPHKRIQELLETEGTLWRLVIERPCPKSRNGYGLRWRESTELVIFAE